MDRRDEDDRRLLISRVLTYDFRQFEPVDFRHADSHEHDRNFRPEQMAQCLAGGVCLEQIHIQVGQDRLVDEKLCGLVVNEQDVHLLGLGSDGDARHEVGHG